MTSYAHNESVGLYLTVLKKGDSSPLLPESDEDRGVGTGRRTVPGQCVGDTPGGGGGGGADPTTTADQPQGPRGPRQPIVVQVDFDGLSKRIIAVPAVPERQYSALRP